MSKLRFDAVVIGAEYPRRLADFYRRVFGFYESSLSMKWGDPADSVRLTAPNFPGHPVQFLFVPAAKKAARLPQANDRGYAHLCFETTNMPGLLRAILANGGSFISQFENNLSELGVYARDPEGNIIEGHIPMPERADAKVIARALGAVVRSKTGLFAERPVQSKFLHVNIVSPDWERSVKFYQDTFSGHRVGKRRDYNNVFIRLLTAMPEAVRVVGEHVSMPDNDPSTTTLEIFTYSLPSDKLPLTMEDQGIICIDFTAQSGEPGVTTLRDPDGNLIRFLRKEDV